MDVVMAVDSSAGAPVAGADPVLDRLAGAVQALVEAIAPGLVSEVRLVTAAPAVPAQTARTLSVVPPVVDGTAEFVRDGVLVDLDRRVLLLDGAPVTLTRREFELMAHFDQRRGVALGRRELMQAIWGQPYVPGDRTVDVHVRRLRVKLGNHADRLATLRGYGYRFD